MRLAITLLNKVSDLTLKYSNLPESYVKRSMEQVYWRNPKGRQYLKNKEIKRKKYHFTTNRPWTGAFHQQNMPGRVPEKVFIEPVLEWSFFKGDRVEILVGRDKGKQGIVSQVIKERNWIIVEGLNTHYRTIGKTKDFPGVVILSEAPLLVTDQVALVDPSDLKSTKVDWRYTESGEKVRVSARTGRIIPVPKSAEETWDYKAKSIYKESNKDTTDDVVSDITYEPSLKTFEMDIMEQMGVKEDRIPPKTYWY